VRIAREENLGIGIVRAMLCSLVVVVVVFEEGNCEN